MIFKATKNVINKTIKTHIHSYLFNNFRIIQFFLALDRDTSAQTTFLARLSISIYYSH